MSEPISIALLVADLVGIFVFALSGGVLAVRHRLDLFGVLVLACATAVTGGIVRDVLIGAIPPATLADWRYLATAIAAGVATFFWHGRIERMHNPVQVFDAAGLALFAVLGTGKALAFGLSPFLGGLVLGGGVVVHGDRHRAARSLRGTGGAPRRDASRRR